MIIILKACGMINLKIHDVFSHFFTESFFLVSLLYYKKV